MRGEHVTPATPPPGPGAGRGAGDGVPPGNALSTDRVRRAVLAGVSYPPDAGELSRLVDSLLAQADVAVLPDPPLALLAPHAALIPVPYSGATAAAAYRQVQGAAFERVVVLAPSHHRHGGAVLLPHPDVDAYATPLGPVRLDTQMLGDIASRLGALAQRVTEEAEHAVEIQLPFLQRCLGQFVLVPLLLEEQTYACATSVAHALVESMDVSPGPQPTLIVASSDLSHGHEETAAAQLDQRVLACVETRDAQELMRAVRSGAAEACGPAAIAATLLAARRLGVQHSRVLSYTTSADITGERQRVVGYAAAAWHR